MADIPHNEQRRLLSAAKELMSDIQDHTKSLHTALHLVQSERAESFQAGEILQDTIMLEMILEEFQGNVPEEFKPFQTFVEQRQKAYSETMGSDFYYNRRKRLEDELSDAASVPEPTEAEKEYMRKAARGFTPRRDSRPKKEKKSEEPPLKHTGKVVVIYSIAAQEQIFEFEENKTAHPLETILQQGGELFSELPEHYTIICIEADQQIKVDELQTLKANPYYRQDREVEKTMRLAAESGKNLFKLQQLYEQLTEAKDKGKEDGK